MPFCSTFTHFTLYFQGTYARSTIIQQISSWMLYLNLKRLKDMAWVTVQVKPSVLATLLS